MGNRLEIDYSHRSIKVIDLVAKPVGYWKCFLFGEERPPILNEVVLSIWKLKSIYTEIWFCYLSSFVFIELAKDQWPSSQLAHTQGIFLESTLSLFCNVNTGMKKDKQSQTSDVAYQLARMRVSPEKAQISNWWIVWWNLPCQRWSLVDEVVINS